MEKKASDVGGTAISSVMSPCRRAAARGSERAGGGAAGARGRRGRGRGSVRACSAEVIMSGDSARPCSSGPHTSVENALQPPHAASASAAAVQLLLAAHSQPPQPAKEDCSWEQPIWTRMSETTLSMASAAEATRLAKQNPAASCGGAGAGAAAQARGSGCGR